MSTQQADNHYVFLDIDMTLIEVLFNPECIYGENCSIELIKHFNETGRVPHTKEIDNYFLNEIEYWKMKPTLHYERTIKELLDMSNHIFVGTYSLGKEISIGTIEKEDSIKYLLKKYSSQLTYQNFYTELDIHKADVWFIEMVKYIQQKDAILHIFEDDIKTIDRIINLFINNYDNEFLEKNSSYIYIHLNEDYLHLTNYKIPKETLPNIVFVTN